MNEDIGIIGVAGTLRVSIALFTRSMRRVQLKPESGLTAPEVSILSRLDNGGPQIPSRLAREEGISPQAVSATLQVLSVRGLVERTADPKDARRSVVSLTEQGNRVLREYRDSASEYLAKLLDREFTAGEIETLRAAGPLIGRLSQIM